MDKNWITFKNLLIIWNIASRMEKELGKELIQNKLGENCTLWRHTSGDWSLNSQCQWLHLANDEQEPCNSGLCNRGHQIRRFLGKEQVDVLRLRYKEDSYFQNEMPTLCLKQIFMCRSKITIKVSNHIWSQILG